MTTLIKRRLFIMLVTTLASSGLWLGATEPVPSEIVRTDPLNIMPSDSVPTIQDDAMMAEPVGMYAESDTGEAMAYDDGVQCPPGASLHRPSYVFDRSVPFWERGPVRRAIRWAVCRRFRRWR